MRNKKSIRNLYSALEETLDQEVAQTDGYKEILSKRGEASEIIENSLDDKDKEMIDQYVAAQNEMESFETEEYFVKGFSMACQLFFDALR